MLLRLHALIPHLCIIWTSQALDCKVRDLSRTTAACTIIFTDSIIADLRVGQVHMIFSLTENDMCRLFPPGVQARVPRHLVYIEWFSSFSADPNERYQMYRVKKLTGSAKIASVVPLTLVERSVHLYPKWGKAVAHTQVSGGVSDLGWKRTRISPSEAR